MVVVSLQNGLGNAVATCGKTSPSLTYGPAWSASFSVAYMGEAAHFHQQQSAGDILIQAVEKAALAALSVGAGAAGARGG